MGRYYNKAKQRYRLLYNNQYATKNQRIINFCLFKICEPIVDIAS